MLDLKNFKKYDAGNLDLLQSRAIILDKLEGFTEKEFNHLSKVAYGYLNKISFKSEKDLDSHIGLLNLWVESLRSRNQKKNNSVEYTELKDHVGVNLHLLFWLLKNPEHIVIWSTPAEGQKVADKIPFIEGVFNSRCEEDPHTRLQNTLFGQTLAMHLLESVFECLAAESETIRKINLNLLIVPLMRVMFSNPDRAHVVYTRYHGILKSDDKCRPFHAMYGAELSVLEEFRSRGVSKRIEVMEEVSKYISKPIKYDQKTEESIQKMPEELQNVINTVLHGSSDKKPVNSPSSKKNQLAQMTCFIRKTESAEEDGQHRRYNNHLGGIHYRVAEVKDFLSTTAWTFTEAEELENALNIVYSQGHRIDFFKNIFEFDSGEKKSKSEAWVQDGEVLFLWLCTAAVKWSKTLKIIEGNGDDESDLLLGEFLERQVSDLVIQTKPESLNDLLVNIMCLVDSGGKACPRYYSLLNFFHRGLVSKRPAIYSEEPWLKIINAAWKNVENDKAAPNEVLNSILQSASNLLKFDFLKKARFQTYYLEILLRKGNPYTFTLFFHPLTFDRQGDEVVPGAFLAGTFIGLELPDYPTCTIRQNYHKNSVLDAIRPIIDFELGRVLSADRAIYAKGQVAKVQADILAKVLPSVEALTEMFNKAQGEALRIKAAMDPDWSGLFSGELYQIIKRVFSVQENDKYLIKFSDGEELKGTFYPKHGSFQNPKLIGSMLEYILAIYLSGKVIQGGCELQKGLTPDILNRKVSGRQLFEENWFMRDFYSILLASIKETRNNNQNPHDICIIYSNLLKVLAVDCMIPNRGLYLLQLAMALKFSGKRTHFININSVLLRDFLPCIPGSTGNLKQFEDLYRHCVGQPDQNHSTSQFKHRYFLDGKVTPVEFLKALKTFLGSALAGNKDDGLLSLTESLVIMNMDESIGVFFQCNGGKWTPNIRDSIWNFMVNKSEEYHDLRSSVNVLSKAVGVPPYFCQYDSNMSNYMSSYEKEQNPLRFVNCKDGCVISITLEKMESR